MPAETAVLAHDADMGADAFSFRLEGRAFAPHFHQAWVLGCVLSGRRHLVVRGRRFLAKAGDIVLVRPGEVHACAPAGEAPFIWRGFHFDPACPAASLLGPLAGVALAAGPVFSGGGLLDALLEAHALLGSSVPAAQKWACLAAALQRPAPVRPTDVRRAPARTVEPGLEALRARLEAQAPERWTLEAMAALARMDKYRLVRAFARMTGATPYRYLESVRVNRAQELLEQGLPAAEAALEAGFTDQSHLSRAMRTRLGVTPGAWRRLPGRSGRPAGRPA
ncbi:MAG: AraC family transcriptional regulator [Desulfovibrio sp.]|nr:AraC family transcriptional regulator [Desulfovibrio sp.]